MAEALDFHPMWESLGMNLADHDMLLGAVGQMYGDMFLSQNNRPKSTSYLDFVATNIHSGRIKEMLDKKEAGEATKIVGRSACTCPRRSCLPVTAFPLVCARVPTGNRQGRGALAAQHLSAHQELCRL